MRKCATKLDCGKACRESFKFLIAMERPRPGQVVLSAVKTWLKNAREQSSKHHLSMASVSVSVASFLPCLSSCFNFPWG